MEQEKVDAKARGLAYQPWCKSHRADPVARALADRHYNRQKPGTPQFVPPGSCCVFVTDNRRAFWVTSAPIAAYVKHAWAGAWVCSAFRSENAGRASDLIRMAVAATRSHYEDRIPALGMVTFIDRRKVRPIMVRGVPTWGYTYRRAGFKEVGDTKGGLLALQLLPADMPPMCPPHPMMTVQMVGFFAGLSLEQKQQALAYRGEEDRPEAPR
jgi:hypothetical protein